MLARTKKLPLLNKHYLKQLMIINLFFSILIIIEDSFVIFNVDQYSSLATKIYNRSISEDIFSIVVCILLLHFFIKERQPQEEKSQEQDASLLIQNFAVFISLPNEKRKSLRCCCPIKPIRKSPISSFFHWERSKPMFITFYQT